jgi:hypothetical protein
MATWLKGNINGAVFQQARIIDAGHGIDLGMTLATLAVPAFTDNRAIRTHNHRTHHRVGRRVTSTLASQLQRTAHVFLINNHSFNA